MFSQIAPAEANLAAGYGTARTKMKSKLTISLPDMQKRLKENNSLQYRSTIETKKTNKGSMFSCKSQQSVKMKKNKSVEKVKPCIQLQRPKTSRVKSPQSLMQDHKTSGLLSSMEFSKSQKSVKTANDVLKKDKMMKKNVSEANLKKKGNVSKKSSLLSVNEFSDRKYRTKQTGSKQKSQRKFIDSIVNSRLNMTKKSSSTEKATQRPRSKSRTSTATQKTTAATRALVITQQTIQNPESEQNLKNISKMAKRPEKVVAPFQNITKKIENKYNTKAVSTGKPDQKYDITSSPGSGFSTSMNVLSESKGSFDSMLMSITSSDSNNPASLMPSQKLIHTFFSKNFLRDYNNSKEVIRKGLGNHQESMSRNTNIVLHQENIQAQTKQFNLKLEHTQTQDQNTVPSSRRETEANMPSDQKYEKMVWINTGRQAYDPSSRNSKFDHSFRNSKSKDQSFTTSQEQGSSRIEHQSKSYIDGQSRSKILEEITMPIVLEAPSARITNSPGSYERSQRTTVQKENVSEAQSLQDFKLIEQRINQQVENGQQQAHEEQKDFDLNDLGYGDVNIQNGKSRHEDEEHLKAEQGSEIKNDGHVDLHAEHYQQTLNTMNNLQLLAPYSEAYRDIAKVYLPHPDPNVVEKWKKEGLDIQPKVLLLDIDETMIHCIDDRDPPSMRGETRLRIGLCSPKSRMRAELSGKAPEMEHIDIDINVRPGLLQCLHNLKQSYQIVSFTASDQLYADAILDYLDPNGEIFSYRLYRQHCVETEYGLIKDLRIIANRSLKDMVIIDNSALSFALNVNNGIPILPFYDNKSDEELKHLGFYLNCLQESKVEDVRVHNEEAFNLLKLGENGDKCQQSKASKENSEARKYEDSLPHTSSQEYLQCDPIEISEDQFQHINNRYQTQENPSHDQMESPVNYLSLLDTNQIIEERSNEDGGLSSRQLSPDKVNQSDKRLSQNCSPLSTSSAYELEAPGTQNTHNTHNSYSYNNKGRFDSSHSTSGIQKETCLQRKQKSLETISFAFHYQR